MNSRHRKLHTLVLLLGLATTAFAYPPAPGVVVYGTVRAADGFPVEGPDARIIFHSGDRTLTNDGIYPALSLLLTNNYQVMLPVDMNPTRGAYRPDVIGDTLPFTARVEIGDRVYVPIESSIGLQAPGEAATVVRLDFTLGIDTDGDGIPDDWEYWLMELAGILPGSAGYHLDQFSRNGDADGDGVTDYQEFLNGTYALQPVDPPTPTNVFDLAIAQTLGAATPGPFGPGDPLALEITVENTGTVTAQQIEVTHDVPPGFLLFDPNWDLHGDRATRTIPGPLAPGAAASVGINLIIGPTVTGAVVLAADITAAKDTGGTQQVVSGTSGAAQFALIIDPPPDPPPGPTETNEVKLAILQVPDASTPGPYAVGDLIGFGVSVYNIGSVTARQIEVAQNIPPGFRLDDPDWTQVGDTATRTLPGPLAPGDLFAVSVRYVIEQLPSNNVALAASITGARDPDGNPQPGVAASSQIDVSVPPSPIDPVDPMDPNAVFDLRLAQSLNTSLTPGPFHPGDPVAFRLELSNHGNVTAQNIVVSHTVPPGFTLLDPAWSQTGATATRTVPGPITPGGTAELDISFILSGTQTGAVDIAAEITSGQNTYGTPQTIPNPSDPIPLTITIEPPDGPTDPVDPPPNASLRLTRTRVGEIVGDTNGVFTVTFRYVLASMGDADLSDLRLSDDLADDFPGTVVRAEAIDEQLAANPDWDGDPSGNVLAPGQSLAAGASGGVLVRYRFVPDAPGFVYGFAAASGRTTAGAMASGGANTLFQIQFASLSDTIWFDANLDGVRQPDETGLPNVAVELRQLGGTLSAQTRTEAGGGYRFVDLRPGVYRVHLPAANFAAAGALADLRPTGATTTALPQTGVSSDRVPVRIGAPNEPAAAGFAFWRLPRIGGAVWTDLNNNGLPDENLFTLGIDQVQIRLFQDAPGGETLLATALSQDGQYRFTGLEPGTYRTEVELGDIPVTLRGSPSTDLGHVATLAANEEALDHDFGFVETPTAVRLERFEARVTDHGVRIEWATAFERDVLGFNVFQIDADGSSNRVNLALILASGGGIYHLDEPGAAGGRYTLEEIRTDLTTAVVGDIVVASIDAAPLGVPTGFVSAEEGTAEFLTTSGFQSYLVTGLKPRHRVLDLTDPDRPRLLLGAVLGGEPNLPHSAYFSASANRRIRCE